MNYTYVVAQSPMTETDAWDIVRNMPGRDVHHIMCTCPNQELAQHICTALRFTDAHLELVEIIRHTPHM